MQTLITAYENNKHHLEDPDRKELYGEFLLKEVKRCKKQYPNKLSILLAIERELQFLMYPMSDFADRIDEIRQDIKQTEEQMTRREEALALYPESKLVYESQDRIRLDIVRDLRRMM